jgi:K+-transporting ATPase KdpF subunit
VNGDVVGYAVSVVIAVLVLAYLVTAMLFPEKF